MGEAAREDVARVTVSPEVVRVIQAVDVEPEPWTLHLGYVHHQVDGLVEGTDGLHAHAHFEFVSIARVRL